MIAISVETHCFQQKAVVPGFGVEKIEIQPNYGYRYK